MTRCVALAFVLAMTSGGTVGAQPGPTPELRSRISGLAAVLGNYDPASPEALDTLRLEAFTPELQKKLGVEQNRAMAGRLRAEFGSFEVTEVRRRDPDTVILVIGGSTGQNGQLVVGLERASPHRVTSIAVVAGEPADESGGPVPAINGRMSPAELTGALERFFGPLAADDQFSGVVLVARDGVPLLTQAYGMADRHARRANTAGTRFNIASINKGFTRVAVAQLMAQGKLALTDTIGQILPDYPNRDARGATVDQLLNHSGGVADFFGAPFRSVPRTALASNADYFRLVAPLPLTFPPGTDRRYCNGCYVVLGEIIARRSGMTYEAYLAEHVFARAGMRSAGFLDDSAPDVAVGYQRRGGQFESNAAMRGARGSAAGGAYAAAADLLAFDNAVREGRLLDPKMTEWYLGGDSIRHGRAREGQAIAGGAPGINAALVSEGTWTVVIVSNFDPPMAEQLASAMLRRLRG